MENEIPSNSPEGLSTTARVQSLYDELRQAFNIIADCKPLAIGALRELVAIGYPSRIAGLALFKHVQKSAYLRAIAAGGERFHIDGSVAGDILDEHRAHAAAKITEFAAKANAKKVAAAALKAKSRKADPAPPAMPQVIKLPPTRRTLSLPGKSGSTR